MPFYNTFTMHKTFLCRRKRLNVLILWLCGAASKLKPFLHRNALEEVFIKLTSNYNLPLAIKNYHGKFSIPSDGSADMEPVHTGDKA